MDLVTLLGSLALGTALAASCGLRAFLPLLLLGLGARLGLVDLGESFAWLASGPAVLALLVGTALELLGDKIPFVNHVLDLLATPVRTVAGMVIFAAPIVDVPLWVLALLAIIVGGGVALAVHVARSGVRAGTTAASAGTASPAHSTFEDMLCFAAATLSLLSWVVSAVVALIAVVLFVWSAQVVWHRVKGEPTT